MPRSLSWLPRLPAIRRTLENSVRSHWERRDIEQLFELQPRAAQLLMDALPTVEVGRSRLVERAALAALLDRVGEAEDPGRALELARRERKQPRRALRTLLPHDHPPADWDRLPPQLELAPGQVAIRFARMEELAVALLELASLLEHDLEGFAQRYEPTAPAAEPDPELEQERQDMAMLRDELAPREAARQAR